jgi:UMF1 family MFS transporter
LTNDFPNLGSFIPITLEQLARERGVLLSDHKTPCRSAEIKSFTDAFDHWSNSAVSTSSKDSIQCVVNILGHEINTASFAMYAFSISVLIQSLVIISMSGAADHGMSLIVGEIPSFAHMIPRKLS